VCVTMLVRDRVVCDNIVSVCVCNICVDVKLQRYFFFHIAGGHRGPWGVGDRRRHPAGTREKRTRKTSVVHLGAFKSQLVATVVLSIYIYIYKVGSRFRFMGFSSQRITTMIQFFSNGAMEPFEATLFRVNFDRLDFRIDIFNSVMRLSKAKQLALLLPAFSSR